ncbi:unnamed protein product [Durusdinium trenchii]|uniref:Uncharacterized protein n=1 Tax=Durusdinium trenchii TaxID=1381693 RepID=A0ABP0KP88_9DINO
MDCFTACSSASTDVNPYDTKWKKSAEYPPDKDSQWEGRQWERDEWKMAHNALRGEMKDLHAAIMAGVERGSLKAHEVNALQDAWVQHKEHLLSNHQNKAEIVMGALSERINVGEKMVNEHKKVSKKMDELDQAFASLQVLSSPDGLLRSFGTYQEELLKVLDYEEHNELILMRYFFAPQEFRPVVEAILSKTPASAVGSLIYYAGDEEFFEFMKQEGMSTFSWYWELRGKRNKFEDNFVQPLQAVASGAQTNTCGLC